MAGTGMKAETFKTQHKLNMNNRKMTTIKYDTTISQHLINN